MSKKWLVMIAGVAVCCITALKVALAAGFLQIQVNVVPFQWKVNSTAYNSTAEYNNGDKVVPTSLNYEGTTYIPIRLLAQTLGYRVAWDAATSTASLEFLPNPDDPIADIFPPDSPLPEVIYYKNKAVLTVSTPLHMEPSGSGAIKQVLLAGTKVSVLREISPTWIEVADKDGLSGYINPLTTDYRFTTNRPTWEQKADAIINTGLAYRGAPYQFGASTKQTDTFDCSSFTYHMYGRHSIGLPRDSRQQSQQGTEVELKQMRKGDLLYFTTPQRKKETGVARIGHVAVYLGDNQVLHTFRTGIGVTITDLDANWTRRIVEVKRVIK